MVDAVARIPRWVPVLLLLSAVAGSAWAQTLDPAGPRWSLDLRYVRALEADGVVDVREFETGGTRLKLRDDLGLSRWDTLGLELVRRFQEGGRLRFGSFSTFVSGSARLDHETYFNGAHYPSGEPVSIGSTSHNRIWAFYEQPLRSAAEPQAWFLLAGVVVDFLDFHIQGNLAPDTARREKRENFGRQVLPYPVLGLVQEGRWTDSLYSYGELYGTYLNGVDTPYTEGGRIRWDQTTLEGAVGVRAAPLPLQPSLGYRYRRFYERTRSEEDDNVFSFHSSSLELGLRASF